MFLPVTLASLKQIASDSFAVHRSLDEERVHNAVIFANLVVPDFSRTSTFHLEVSGPELDREDRIFVHWPKSAEATEQFLKKFPDREVRGVRPDNKKGPTV